MRKIRIVGVDPENSQVRCVSDDTDEEFVLPLDDRLRAAAKGELPDAPERSSGAGIRLRPREIQERIRHGATPEAVAAEAGVPISRIEGFTYPVILERANAADRARQAHPLLAEGPALDTLEERLTSALRERGIRAEDISWDAWLSPDGIWRIRTSWPSGRTEAQATWDYTSDSHGGSARAVDDEAENILDPERAARLRSVQSSHQPEVQSGDGGGASQRSVPRIRSIPVPEEALTNAPGSQPPAEPNTSDEVPGAASGPSVPIRLNAAHEGASTDPDTPTDPGTPADPATHETSDPARESAQESDEDFLLHTPSDPQPKRPARRHPTMPSWEDVLLGVRSKDS